MVAWAVPGLLATLRLASESVPSLAAEESAQLPAEVVRVGSALEVDEAQPVRSDQ